MKPACVSDSPARGNTARSCPVAIPPQLRLGYAPLYPQHHQGGKNANEECHPPIGVMQNNAGHQRRQRISNRPRALHDRNGLGSEFRRPGFSHQGCSCVPFASHAEPEDETEDGEHQNRGREARGERTNRIGEDAQHQCALASRTVGNESECHASDPRGQQGQAVEQTSYAFAHAQVAHDVGQHERVEHGVKGIEHPAQSGSNQSASLRRSNLGKCRRDARSHSQDCRLFAQDWQQ